MSNGRKFDSSLWIVIAGLGVAAILAGFASAYSSGQSAFFLSRLVDTTIGPISRRSAWTTLREGAVLGRAVPKKGEAAYLVSLRLPDGEYRAIAEVDGDGSVLRVHALGGTNSLARTRRLGALFARSGKSGAGQDSTPLDASLEPIVGDALETITRLERQRTEGEDGDRR
ncbi:MAG: hypothetical protein KKA67_13860 [Spirochaetes bacterium]|nr:hypothetical protein [Spirochaetota bacterium]MBU1082156.1 hypothetical protein [Spirochaetota bacterium]